MEITMCNKNLNDITNLHIRDIYSILEEFDSVKNTDELTYDKCVYFIDRINSIVSPHNLLEIIHDISEMTSEFLCKISFEIAMYVNAMIGHDMIKVLLNDVDSDRVQLIEASFVADDRYGIEFDKREEIFSIVYDMILFRGYLEQLNVYD